MLWEVTCLLGFDRCSGQFGAECADVGDYVVALSFIAFYEVCCVGEWYSFIRLACEKSELSSFRLIFVLTTGISLVERSGVDFRINVTPMPLLLTHLGTMFRDKVCGELDICKDSIRTQVHVINDAVCP